MRIYEQGDKLFLSDNPRETGSVSWYAILHAERSKSHWAKPDTGIEAELKISDCFNTITLEFDSGNSAGQKKRISKVRALIDSLERFEKTLVEARSVRAKAILDYRARLRGKRFNKDEKDDSSS